MGIVNDIKHAWKYLVDGKEVIVYTAEKNEALSRVELVKSMVGTLNEKNAKNYFSQLKKKYQIELAGVEPVKIPVKY